MTAHDDPHIFILGATSSLAMQLADQLAAKKHPLILYARQEDELKRIATDLSIRYDIPPPRYITAQDDHTIDDILQSLPTIRECYCLIGDMGDGDSDDPQNQIRVITHNYQLPAQWISAVAERMSQQEGGGKIALIASVAGDRGRQSNYLYGSSKAAIATFADGLRHRYAQHPNAHQSPVHVMTVKPGYIDTPMTYNLDSPLKASRSYVASHIIRHLRQNKPVLYTPFFWRYIMWIIKLIPDRIFRKLPL